MSIKRTNTKRRAPTSTQARTRSAKKKPAYEQDDGPPTVKTRLRTLLLDGAASRPTRMADGRYFAGLREGIRHYRLEDLLKKTKKKKLHPEIDFGPPKGREVW